MDRATGAMAAFPLFEAERSVEVVNARMGPEADPRLAEIMSVVVTHLHAAVREARITGEEWLRGIEFLTETGRMCSDWRQEFILLSDALGVSMLVDAINHDRPAGSTENTVLGPFHLPGAPRYANGANICLDGKGEPMVVTGRVTDTAGNPVAGATLDVWAANDEGFYDVQQKGVQPDMNLRGIFTSDDDGRYWFRSVKPRFYPIPDDGTVGQMLKALGRHPYRPAHIHFIVNASGYQTITTHIFTPDDPYLESDAVFGVKQSLIVDFVKTDDPDMARELGFEGPFWQTTCDFVLARA